MEVNANFGTSGIGGPVPPKRSAANGKKAVETASFASSAAMDKTLKNAPDSRPEAVDRAKGLISDVAYPPLETIKKISKLLAININSDKE
jgi:hypothetical protein